MNIYVGNLAYDVKENDLQQAFAAFGRVSSAKVINDMYTGQSKGFGFIEMDSNSEAQEAIAKLNGIELKGRNITVNEARPKNDRNGGSGGSRGRQSW